MTLAGTLELIERARLSRPVVVFSYLNPDSPLRRRALPARCRRARRRRAAAHRPAGRERSRRRVRGPGEPARSHPAGRADHAARTSGRRGRRARRASCISSRASGVTGATAVAGRWAGGVDRPGAPRRRRCRSPSGFGISHAGAGARGGGAWPTAWWWEARWSTSSARDGVDAARATSSRSLRAGARRPEAAAMNDRVAAAGRALRPGPAASAALRRRARWRWRSTCGWLLQPLATLLSCSRPSFALRASPVRLSKYSYLTQSGIAALVGAVCVGPTPVVLGALVRRLRVRRALAPQAAARRPDQRRPRGHRASSAAYGPYAAVLALTRPAGARRSTCCRPPPSSSACTSSSPGRCSTSPCWSATSSSTSRRS